MWHACQITSIFASERTGFASCALKAVVMFAYCPNGTKASLTLTRSRSDLQRLWPVSVDHCEGCVRDQKIVQPRQSVWLILQRVHEILPARPGYTLQQTCFQAQLLVHSKRPPPGWHQPCPRGRCGGWVGVPSPVRNCWDLDHSNCWVSRMWVDSRMVQLLCDLDMFLAELMGCGRSCNNISGKPLFWGVVKATLWVWKVYHLDRFASQKHRIRGRRLLHRFEGLNQAK